MSLRQWSAVIEDTDLAIASGLDIADVYFMQGVAYCNLEEYQAAEEAYSAGIELAPDYPLLYLLRAEARQKQGNSLAALGDMAAVTQSEQADIYAPFVAAAAIGAVTCENFFDVALVEGDESDTSG